MQGAVLARTLEQKEDICGKTGEIQVQVWSLIVMSQYWFLVVTHVLWLCKMLLKGEIGHEYVGVFCLSRHLFCKSKILSK